MYNVLCMMSNIKVFLVDDDLFSLNIYRQYLENVGLKNIQLFLNGRICLNNLHQKPSMIFLNHPIDDSSSFELLQKIKQYRQTIYVVILSKQENINMAADAMKHGAFDYIVKGDNEIIKMKNVIERIFSLG
jgi:DNA-binding NtrC family response regulator